MIFNEQTVKAFADNINAEFGTDLRCIRDDRAKIFNGEQEFIIVQDWADAWERLFCFKTGLQTMLNKQKQAECELLLAEKLKELTA